MHSGGTAAHKFDVPDRPIEVEPGIDPLAASLSDDGVPVPSVHEKRKAAPLSTRVVVLLAVGLPLLGLIAGIVMLWGRGVDWLHICLLAGGYVLTGLGITIGYHRLFTHKSFETGRMMTAFFGILGSMAAEGALLRWVGTHRMHHQHSDNDADPHSPHHREREGVRGLFQGLWHAHLGWIFLEDPKNLSKYTPDLRKRRVVRAIHTLFPLWVLLGLLIPTGLGFVIGGTWMDALLGFIWGGLIRIFVVHHITWSINSVCHIWGFQSFHSHDESKNNIIFGIVGFGEGWHNNHHAFPTSARHGLKWWQIDASYMLIKAMEWLGLAWNVRVPSASRLAARTIA
jgi:stearoyl-CoA desaturase (delta-9 desaturase)